MRLDKFLKVSRVIKRRTVAAEAAEAGRIMVNGKVAKPSTTLHEGDIIEITFGNRVGRYEVLALLPAAGKQEAGQMVKELL